MLATATERRQDRRIAFVSEITYWVDNVPFKRRSSDLSADGMFIEDCSPPPDGTPVKVLYIFHDCPILASGKVVGSQPPIGFGISLDEIGADDRELVALTLAAEDGDDPS